MYHLKSILISICIAATQFAHATTFGVGFSLAIDHGVASVHFRNGSTVNIAKVEGPEAYRIAMEVAVHIPSYAQINLTDAASLSAPSCSYARLVPQPEARLAVQSLRDRLPPWLGGKKPDAPDAAAQALERMLRVLKIATESYLETDIRNAIVATPYDTSDAFRSSMRTASSALDIETRLYGAAQISNWAFDIPHNCPGPFGPPDTPYEDDELVLGMDFSKAAFTATLGLFAPGCGVWEDVRVGQSAALGAKNLFAKERWHDMLVNAMRKVTALPVDHYPLARDINHISRLVLIGESVEDKRFEGAVRQVFSEQYSAQATSKIMGNAQRQDPVYVTAIGGAVRNWFNSDDMAWNNLLEAEISL
ncbi:hypothetical protein WHR41_07792 [Cladosporium halotolerans]|uniref:Uncharacterized protein n=1 Tax=Cladosporium halotolerans TaxID=1052096 RepID=A0AB34KIY9_9PEZI